MEQSHEGEAGETINQWEQKFGQLQTIIESYFHNYNSCLPRLIAPRQLEANGYPYEYLIEIAICQHDAMKKFAEEIDIINDNNNFIDSLRFGTCDKCSEAYFPAESSNLKQ